MKITRPVSGKIFTHEEAMGTPSSESVRHRALELAVIDGRAAPNEQDWKRAFLELHGGHHDLNALGDESEMLGGMSETDRVAPSLGRRLHEEEIDGGESLGEELIAEGIEEAAHDQMLESRRSLDLREEKEE